MEYQQLNDLLAVDTEVRVHDAAARLVHQIAFAETRRALNGLREMGVIGEALAVQLAMELNEALTARTTAHVHEVVDDALEERGLEPQFYEGPLYRVQHWLQRHALVVLPTTVNGKDLPGAWRTPIPGRCRLHTAAARAGLLLEGSDSYREMIVLEDGNLDEVHRWWASRTWYRVYGIFTRRGNARPRFADQVLIVPDGLVLPDEPAILWLAERFEDVPAYEVELGAAVNAVDDVFEQWTVCRTQAELDAAIAEWADQETC